MASPLFLSFTPSRLVHVFGLSYNTNCVPLRSPLPHTRYSLAVVGVCLWPHKQPSESAGKHSTLIPVARSGVIIGPSHPSNGEDDHTLLKFFDWGSFKVLDGLGEGRAGTVFKDILHDETIALKLCDLWQHPDHKQELLNEVKIYHILKDLQGDCIPRLKGAGYTAGKLFAIATDIVGRSLGDAESLGDASVKL